MRLCLSCIWPIYDFVIAFAQPEELKLYYKVHPNFDGRTTERIPVVCRWICDGKRDKTKDRRATEAKRRWRWVDPSFFDNSNK